MPEQALTDRLGGTRTWADLSDSSTCPGVDASGPQSDALGEFA